ncbi:MAG: restriction endonuclease subunit R [Merismopedia sp. SIO2A8]|nr:restriction endonuclease subunit R [Symploca sp. SIO2B6]NET49315.1 restriction endonuclease subunit R [Merismopedia sp. SIO2A8]
MIQVIPATDVTLRTLKQSFNLKPAPSQQFFAEWTEAIDARADALSDMEQRLLDRVQTNFLDLLDDPPVLENSVKMVVLAPLLDLAGFYRRPYRMTTETSVEIALEDDNQVIRGRIDVLGVNQHIWLAVIESKRSDFAATRALAQTLSYMLANPDPERSTFGLITNGSEFMFLKAQRQPTSQYATSKLFSLFNPNNELYPVLAILKYLGNVGF